MKKILVFNIFLCFLVFWFMCCGSKVPQIFIPESEGIKYPDKQFMRVHYFSGKTLTSDDFNQDQNYYIGKSQLINHAIYGTGVVCGLWVKANPRKQGQVIISSGLAIDGEGKEIFVSKDQLISLDGYSDDVYLVVKYKETLINPIPISGVPKQTESDEMVYSNIREDFEFLVLKSLPKNYVSTYDLFKKLKGKNALEYIFQNHSTCNINEDVPVVLAKIHIQKSGKIKDDDIDNIKFRNLILNSSDILYCLIGK